MLINEIKRALKRQARPSRNLGTYSTTCMAVDARQIIEAALPFNRANRNEYPALSSMENYCVAFLLGLAGMKDGEPGVGTATSGSSEAILVACLAWKLSRTASSRSNIIVSTESHSAWDSAAKFLDLEIRRVSFRKENLAREITCSVDGATIGVAVTLGTTATGAFEPVKEINTILAKYRSSTGMRVPIHVDAASGGFVAPFVYPELEWGFHLSHVDSINISGHKYGLVYPSVGWALWKSADMLSSGLYTNIDYLKGRFHHVGASFSYPSAFIVAQYYNLKKYGPAGYKRKLARMYQLKDRIENSLRSISCVEVLSCSSEPRLPVVCWTVTEALDDERISKFLEECGWIVPRCEIERGQSRSCFRIVVRSDLRSGDVEKLISNLYSAHDQSEV